MFRTKKELIDELQNLNVPDDAPIMIYKVAGKHFIETRIFNGISHICIDTDIGDVDESSVDTVIGMMKQDL